MGLGSAILLAVISSTGLFGFFQYLIMRHDNKQKDLKDIKKQLQVSQKIQDQTIQRVTRLELKGLIKDDPDNIDAILQVAEYYFVELDADGYMHSLFEKWSIEHNVPTHWVPQLNRERSKDDECN